MEFSKIAFTNFAFRTEGAFLSRELQNCDAMEFFENRNVLSLRQMSMTKDEPDEPDWQIKRNVLPFARWEELVKKRISSLPKLLQHELLDNGPYSASS
ncbi:UNVERIFIED_CONTAM: hypothetical protein NCL1_47093 [Trichonephila clavipes]